MASETEFTERVLKAFKSIIKEIEKGSVEHDIRPRFVKYFVEPVLGYSGSNYKYEEKRTDITIFDENNFAVVKIETKRPTESIDKTQHEEQAFKYEEETTKFIGLTNFLQFKLWEVKKTGSELRLNLDFSKILEQRKPIETLSAEEKSQILFLNNLTKEALFDPSKYEKFDETYARIDITKDRGFRKLLDRLNFIANNLLLGYTLKAFGEYKEGYGKYQAELSKAESESKNNKRNHELNHGIAKYKQKLEEKYLKYKTFSGYELWKDYSGKGEADDDEVKEVFCKETIYVLLNKLLFIRICEDKAFLKQNISNGGIEQLRKFLIERVGKDEINKEVLEFAYKSAKNLYSHFYEVGILDWFRTGDGELNELLNRVLWTLNQFDFTHIDRDILGNLYEKYLPSGERKRLGEFYTPTEVIDYILTSVGYTYSYDIETKDLLDPACGSGGFLVRASRRLISRYLMKFGKTDKGELRDPKNWKEIASRLSPDEAKIILESIQEHIYGLDINPFACHIAEMNLLFQIIDLYQKVREKYPDYQLKRFRIYRTDSLEKPAQKQLIDYTYATFLEERDEIDKIKEKKFDFVVENPPYVRKEKISTSEKKHFEENYKSVYHGDNDLCVYFLYRSINWLNEKGKFGVIVSSKFIKTRYGKYIRAFIAENVHIARFIDLKGSNVFANVTVDPCVLILDKEKSNEMRVVEVKKDFEEEGWEENLGKLIWHIFRNSTKNYQDGHINSFSLNQETLKNEIKQENGKKICDEFRLVAENQIDLLNKIKTNVMCLDKISERVEEGLTTGRNDVFIVDSNIIKSEKLEKDILKPLIKGEDIRRYNTIFKNIYVIYTKNVEINNFPNIKTYLSKFKSELENRATVKYQNKKWYELQKPRDSSIFEQMKIVTPDISTTNNFALDVNYYYCLDTSKFIILKNEFKNLSKYILALLNSRLLEFYLKSIASYLGKEGYRYKTQYLNRLPIKLPEKAEEKKIANEIIKRVDEILGLHKSGIIDIDAIIEGEETEKLANLAKVMNITENAKFERVKLDDSKIYISSQDFIEIKEKKNRDFVEVYLSSNSEKLAKSKDVKNLILNIRIPKSDEILKEIINKGGDDQSQIREKIKKLEDEINELVYRIYGITKEERKIVEENL